MKIVYFVRMHNFASFHVILFTYSGYVFLQALATRWSSGAVLARKNCEICTMQLAQNDKHSERKRKEKNKKR